jgi:hypothetical protein
METQKITVTLPRQLLKKLDAVVPPRKRSSFIVKAVQEQLAILEQAQAVDEAAGIWQDDDYPELGNDRNIDQWLAQLRQDWQREVGDAWDVLDALAGTGEASVDWSVRPGPYWYECGRVGA